MPETSLQELKQHPKILDLYRAKLSLKQDGKRWRGLCIWHADSHAGNFDVFQHQGTWIHKCLSCGVSVASLILSRKRTTATCGRRSKLSENLRPSSPTPETKLKPYFAR